MASKIYPIGRKHDIVVQEVESEVLIYDLQSNKAFCLNKTSASVWNLCDGTKSVSEISQSLSKKLKLPANEYLVWLALEQLKKEKLIENELVLENPFAGMSRREVIKKVGLGTLIALPIVASIVAPTAANAASPCAGYPITENNLCTSSCQCQGRSDGAGGFIPSTCCQISDLDVRLVCRETPGSAICAP